MRGRRRGPKNHQMMLKEAPAIFGVPALVRSKNQEQQVSRISCRCPLGICREMALHRSERSWGCKYDLIFVNHHFLSGGYIRLNSPSICFSIQNRYGTTSKFDAKETRNIPSPNAILIFEIWSSPSHQRQPRIPRTLRYFFHETSFASMP